MKLLRSRDIVCRQAVELMTDYLEGRLSRAGQRRFEAHLVELPALHRVPGAAARGDQAYRTGGGAGRSSAADAGRSDSAVPAVAVRAVMPRTAATGIKVSWGSW